jgi:hypothetical protein
MSFKSSVSKILEKKNTLHIVFVIALLNLIGYLVSGNFSAFIFFILITTIVGHFSKNVTIILLVPLFIVNLYVLGNRTKEGMENSNSSNNTDKTQSDNKNQTQTQDSSGNTLQTTIQKINDKVSTNQGLPITPIDQDTKTNDTTTKNSTNKQTEESFEVGRNKKGKYDIDYASTIEDAYDELNKIIGGDGIKKLTGDTQNLMKQQMQLAEAMKSMGPLVEQMGPLMQSVGPMIEQAKGMMGSGSNNIADLAKNFTAGGFKK